VIPPRAALNLVAARGFFMRIIACELFAANDVSPCLAGDYINPIDLLTGRTILVVKSFNNFL
jgi:hypothetical protein